MKNKWHGLHCVCVWLPSLLMPKARHFCRRQCWQRLRLVRSIRQFLWREHEYMALFCWLRRKKPWTHTHTHNITVSDGHLWGWIGRPGSVALVSVACFTPHLAAFAGDDSIVDSWGLISTDLTGNDLDLSYKITKPHRQKRWDLHAEWSRD